MNGFEVVVGVIGAFFVLGIAIGVIVMIALSAIRYRRALHSEDWHGRRNYPLGWPDRGGLDGPPGPDGYSDDPDLDPGGQYGDGPPSWPGA